MTRMSKQGSRRALSPRKRKHPAVKTGPKKDHLEKGYKEHFNAQESVNLFIPKVK